VTFSAQNENKTAGNYLVVKCAGKSLEIPADFSEILKTIKPQENAFQWRNPHESL
jgi:hypothetical protein